MRRKPDFQVSELTLRVVARLRRLRQGEMVSWRELSTLLGIDAQEGGRHHVDSARRILVHQDRRVCEVVPGEGVKWLTDAELPSLGPFTVGKIHRAARRGRRKLRCLTPQGYAALTREQQLAYNTGQAILGMFEQQSTAREVQYKQEQIANHGMPFLPDLNAFLNS